MAMFGPDVEPAPWDSDHKYTVDSVQVLLDAYSFLMRWNDRHSYLLMPNTPGGA